MFLGHYAVALGAKRVAPRLSLGTAVLAAQLLDGIWPVLLLLGVERVRIVPGLMAASPLDFEHYPISHSLLMAVVWGVLLGGGYYLVRRDRRAATVVGAAVVSHWLLDAPMHRPDLPLWPGSAVRVGGGMWNSVPWTLAVELTLLAAGVALYLRATWPRDRTGRWALVAMLATLLAVYLGSSEPPPSEEALAWGALALWLFVPWGYWVDRHREPRTLPHVASAGGARSAAAR